MSEGRWLFVLEDLGFWLTVCFDFTLVFSLVLALVYAASLGLVSILPSRWRLEPRAWGLPVLFILSLAAVISPIGESAATILAAQIVPLIIRANLDRLPLIVACVWLAGVGLGLARLAFKARRLKKLLANLAPAEADPALDQALQIIGARKPLIFKQPGPGLSASSWGLFKTLIVIPEGFDDRYALSERLGIYLHELIHIRNRDSARYLIMAVLGRLMWFNPLVGRAIERYRCHLEIVCDRQVTASGRISPLDYARLMAKTAGGPRAPLTGFSGDYQSITRRFSYIFKDKTLRLVNRDRLAAGLCLAAAVLLAILAANQQPAGETPEEFQEMAQVYNIPPDKVRLTFYWQGALGAYSQVEVDK